MAQEAKNVQRPPSSINLQLSDSNSTQNATGLAQQTVASEGGMDANEIS